MDVLATWETLLLVIAFGTLCMTGNNSTDIKQINQRRHYATVLLYLSGFTLAIGVLEFDLLFRLAGNTKKLQLSSTQFDDLKNGLAVLAGTSCSLLIAALFIPTMLIINADSDAMAVKENLFGSSEQLLHWKKENGLDQWHQGKIVKLIAVMLPVITGWLSEPVSKLLASILTS